MDYEEDLVLNSVTYTDCVPLQTFECNYIIYKEYNKKINIMKDYVHKNAHEGLRLLSRTMWKASVCSWPNTAAAITL